ncbi:hypothetical protein DQP57_00355 [Mycobacterium colombiense]|uniref:Head-tail adaptor protein n=1 Tax=Mycobacterium colombiense TaxID=339268 RepID=A0A329MCF3_9MYCO|nr:hypothetical protein [Mycobacterium colombiense]RAV17510.1 hypothetical protein DQP57_00355 [Mycobacterium colombiense]
MPQNPGALAITFNPPGDFVVDKYHTVPASEGASPFTQVGCTKQPISVRDKIDNTAYSEATHKIYTPYNTNTAQISAEWTAVYNGISYRVMGIEITPDDWGRIDFCRFICKQQEG